MDSDNGSSPGSIAILIRGFPGISDFDEGYVVSITGPEGQVNHPPNGHWTGGQSLGLASNAYHSGAGSCGEPIDLGSGNMFYQATDYETAGQNKLSLIRYYNSMAAADTYAISMGGNWRTSYDRYLHVLSSTAVEVERPDGQVLGFYQAGGGAWTPSTDIDLKLSNPSGSTWTLTDHDDTVETYTVASGKGTLNSIKLRNGFTEALGYSSGQLSYVSDSYGRQLGFSYSSAGNLTGVTTPDSLSLTYGYMYYTSTSQYQLQTVTYNTSPTTSQTYLYEGANYPFALTGITDDNGNRYATWSYDGTGRAILSELSGGVNYSSVYYNDTNGNRVVKGPLGIVETYKFNTLQGVPKVTEIDRAANGSVAFASEGFTYDANGYPATKTDWNRNITAWTNNSHGQPTQIIYASATTNAQTTNITYDLSWPHLQHTVSTNGLNSNFTYDSSGNMLTRTLTDTTSTTLPYSTNGQTRTWTYTYNRTGEVLTAQLPRTDLTATTTYGYAGGTTGGTLVSITDALSHVTTINTATGGGLPTKITDPNSLHTTLSWTTRNWLSSSVLATSAGNLTTSFTYDSAGNLTKATLPDNSYLSYGYDNAHRVTSITNALGESKGITYDSAGDVTQELWKNASNVTKRQHTATYDALGRMLTSVGGASQTTSYAYDSNSNVQKITDPLSNVTYISSDQLNRPYRYEDAALDTSCIAYDSHDRPLTVTDPRSRVTSFVYDGFGDAIQQNSPDSLKTIYYYDEDSNLTGKNEPGINFSSATYDALDRMLTRTYAADSSLNVSATYDETTGHGFGVGHLTSATDQTGSLSRSYDERGNVTTDAKTIISQLYSNTYTYDSAGRYSSITYASSGWKVAYTRDSAGQITAVTDTRPGHTATNLATSITHMPFGPASSWTYGNGVTDTRTFDQDYRMTSVTDTGTGNIQYLSYGYDADNNVTSITDHVTPADNQTLGYDNLSRVNYASGPYGTVSSITYDSNSNRKTYGATNYTIPGSSNRISKAGTTSISYNSTGNYTANGADTQTYYKTNQLATNKVSGTTNTYWYDLFGERLKVDFRGNPIRIEIPDLDGNLITQTSGASIIETDYVYLDGMPIYAISPGTALLSALHTDNIGTVQRATNAAKTIVWTGNYDPFGAVTSTTSIIMNLRLPHMLQDKTGYYHNGFRDYYPSYGRYIEVDPIGLAGSPTPPIGGYNPYPYALNNPITNIDPYGLWQVSFVLGYGGAISGTFGYNSGQANFGFQAGLGKALQSASIKAIPVVRSRTPNTGFLVNSPLNCLRALMLPHTSALSIRRASSQPVSRLLRSHFHEAYKTGRSSSQTFPSA
jgi:RHS repeat-associated protein